MGNTDSNSNQTNINNQSQKKPQQSQPRILEKNEATVGRVLDQSESKGFNHLIIASGGTDISQISVAATCKIVEYKNSNTDNKNEESNVKPNSQEISVEKDVERYRSHYKLVHGKQYHEFGIIITKGKTTKVNHILQILCHFFKECAQKKYEPVIYYTGHGGTNNGNWCFVDGYITLDQLWKIYYTHCYGFRLELHLDCCYSGQWIKEFIDIVKPIKYPLVTPWAIMAACGSNKYAYTNEYSKLLFPAGTIGLENYFKHMRDCCENKDKLLNKMVQNGACLCGVESGEGIDPLNKIFENILVQYMIATSKLNAVPTQDQKP